MNPIQSLLVHLDGSARAASRLQFAHELAMLHRATLSALFAVAPRLVELPLESRAPRVPLVEEIDPVHRRGARALFEQTVGKGAAASSWHEIDDDMPIPAFVERAFLADLLVLGQRDPGDADSADVPANFVDAVIVDSGRPAVVVPYTGPAAALPDTVLVAWKPTREAAHAVSAALPFLRRAKNVHVVCAEEGVLDARRFMKQLRHFLGLHGIAPSGDDHLLASGNVGEGLLSQAADVGADLLVMGCYGHARSREFVLGGATRTVLRSMTLPVLMAH